MQTSQCKSDFYDFQYVIEMYDNNWTSYGYNYVTSQFGFGDIKVDNLPKGDYYVEVYRYKNPTNPIDLQITTWTSE